MSYLTEIVQECQEYSHFVCLTRFQERTASTNSEKFPNVFGGRDSNLYIWKNYLIFI